MDGDASERILEELQEIKHLLAIQTFEKKDRLREKLTEKFLTSEGRKEMYSQMDGTNSMSDIADIAEVDPSTVSKFVDQMEESGVITVRVKKRSKYPEAII